jgi:putative protein-disulfide isomerase
MTKATLVYVHDPMCSWCWGFRPVLRQLLQSLPAEVEVQRVLGGLAPDSNAPMPEELQHYLQHTWRLIQEKIPGTVFNFDFWVDCNPRRSTYPACRSVIAARKHGSEYDEQMTYAIQRAYYLESKNPSDDSVLVTLADSLGLDPFEFSEDLHSPATQQILAEEIRFARQLGVQGFPGLILLQNDTATRIEVDYTNAESMSNSIASALSD